MGCDRRARDSLKTILQAADELLHDPSESGLKKMVQYPGSTAALPSGVPLLLLPLLTGSNILSAPLFPPSGELARNPHARPIDCPGSPQWSVLPPATGRRCPQRTADSRVELYRCLGVNLVRPTRGASPPWRSHVPCLCQPRVIPPSCCSKEQDARREEMISEMQEALRGIPKQGTRGTLTLPCAREFVCVCPVAS